VSGLTGDVCRFGVLGPLVLEQDGRGVTLPSGRQRSLLALLLLAGGVPLSRDRLMDELWGDHPPASAVSALHVHLSKLRALLGGLLALEGAGYALRPGGFELDVWRFDALVEQARDDAASAPQLLREALDLFRGEPLCDVASEGSVAQWRRALEEKRLQAIILRHDALLAAGAAGELVADLERLAGEHPFEERLWGQLMLALYRAGRLADALDAYQRARRLFAAELGLEPGEPLGALQRQILDRDPALAAPGPAQSPFARVTAPAAESQSNLPRSLTRLVGREAELDALSELVADPDVRIVTLTGPGGVGKTRLLLELARRHEHDPRDGTVLVRLEGVTDPALVAAEIAAAFAAADGTEGPSADGLGAYLREREVLLAIDNFEHLLAAAPLVAELLGPAPGVLALVSSRTAMRIRGEQTFEVEPLALPAGDSDDELSASPAVQMFVQCARSANRKLVVDASQTQTIAAICNALDGLPLAIELAASRSHSLSPDQIADRLTEPLSIGANALRDLPDRQRTLQATIQWSYDLLSPEAQHVLSCASVFLGGFTPDALEAVAGDPVQQWLEELLEASLARRRPEEDRFELLELVRAFAHDALVTRGADAEAHERHRAFFVDRVAPASVTFDGGGAPGEVAAPLLADLANLRAAMDDAIGANDDRSAVALALGMRPLWLALMLRRESQDLVDRLLERFSVPAPSEVSLLRAVAFIDYGPNASTWHRRLAERAAAIGDHEALAMATGNLFARALNARDLAEMRRLRPSLQGLLDTPTTPRALGWTHSFLALDAYVEGDYSASVDQASLSERQGREIGHDVMLASAVGARLLAQSARDGTLAHADLSEAVAVMRRPSVQPLAAFTLWLVARYAAAVDAEAAGRWLAHAERIVAQLDSELWPERVLRDEALEVLGISDLAPLLATTPPLDHAAALDEAADWLAQRDPTELAPRYSGNPQNGPRNPTLVKYSAASAGSRRR
jgi:predicted ATPase/DNA-binding SARP family transcriptional activator